MTDENKENKIEFDSFDSSSLPVKPEEEKKEELKKNVRTDRRPRTGGRKDGGKREGKPRSEFDQKTIIIRRVARMVAGGRRFNFSVAMVIGDRKGRVGVGTGKGQDTALAIEKAARNAKRHMIKVRTTKSFSIPHEIEFKFASARVLLMPAKGRGMIAGSAVRMVLELAGLKDINAKILSGSKNGLNIARATVKALSLLKTPREKNK